ncbi:MAG: hypothetical protein ABIY55_10900 [Kofleriaceae bacterium]
MVACDRAPWAGSAAEVDRETADPAACWVDDDCTLMPSVLTCCEECDPVPPFDAVPRTAVDAVLIELETRCASKPPICRRRSCEAAPPGCEARAICLRGRCAVVQTEACGARLALTGSPSRAEAVCATGARGAGS